MNINESTLCGGTTADNLSFKKKQTLQIKWKILNIEKMIFLAKNKHICLWFDQQTFVNVNECSIWEA